MKQARMRFATFVWPVNPCVITVRSGRDTARAAAYGDEHLEALGNRGRIVEGSGVFPGPEGQRRLEELRLTARRYETAALFVPGTGPMEAVLLELSAEGRPGPEETAYTFRFAEQMRRKAQPPPDDRVYIAGSGESLWHIAASRDVPIEELLRANSHIPHPWAVQEGQEVALP